MGETKMSKAKSVTVSDEARALVEALTQAKRAQSSAMDAWIPVYASASALVVSTTARDMAAQLSALGASCNKDTAQDYADAYPLSEYMAREDDRDDTEWMRAAVAANQSAFLLPHECVSYARVYGGMTRAAIRDLIADAVAAHEDKGDTAITKAIKALRTKAPKKRDVVPPVPPIVDDETGTDAEVDTDTDVEVDTDNVQTFEERCTALAMAVVGPMEALNALMQEYDSLPPTTVAQIVSGVFKAHREIAQGIIARRKAA